MQFTTTSIILGVAMLAAARPQVNVGESKFANAATKSSCSQIAGGPNGYYCTSDSKLYRCTAGTAEFCQQCGVPTFAGQASGCVASNDGTTGYCFQGSTQSSNCGS
ncbi:hypothetical protein AC578_1755 [Pseudocercospora eumusae]|uniref:Endo-1,3(4)-beta-glucanase 1 carbohydrate binding domain-containing protein n=1 Tax=Pseudocercospora eumusae TaxID=321146 RepID=A0A139H7V1_9PEZI|nr:hypothetical protein AC578_1755 [Pseudocercospora eumusae]